MYIFIVNPVAGNGKTIKSMDKVDEYLNHKQIPFEVMYTKAPGEATDMASELKNSGDVTAVIAVGGDGTVAEVAAGLLNADCPMGIIPSGTGNDYRRSLQIPDDTVKAVDTILNNQPKKVDTVKINGKTFLNITTVGFDVEVLKRAPKYKLFGEASYTLAAIDRAFFAKPNRARIIIDGEEKEKEFLLFAAGCGAYYGGGMNPLPGANPFDGMLDVCLIDNVPTFKILSLLPKYKTGEHYGLGIAHFSKAKNIKIISENKLSVNADGDVLPPVNELEYQIVPGNLNILSGG